MGMDYFGRGTLEDYIDRLCETMKYVDKEWSERVKPATAEQIERLYGLAKFEGSPFQLPMVYMAYLKRMGQDDGGLLECGQCTGVNIDTICRKYENYAVYTPEFDRSRYLLIATDWTDSELYLDLTKGDNPPIYCNFHANGLYASSFEKFTFQMAFDIMMNRQHLFCDFISLSLQKVQALLGRPYENKENFGGTMQERLAFAMKLLEPYSLQQAWFSDEVRCCCFGEKMAVKVDVSFAISIAFSGDDKILIQKMKEELERKVINMVY